MYIVQGDKPAAPAALPPAREELRAVIAAGAVAQRAAAEVGERDTRLHAPIMAAAEALARLNAARASDTEALADWLTDPVGPRPGPSAATAAAEEEFLRLGVDAAAARSRQPQVQAALAAAVQRVQQIGQAKVAAIAAVIEAEVVPRLLAEMSCDLEAMLGAEARLRALAAVLRDHRPVAIIAERIEADIRRTKTSAGVPREDHWARAYWAGLASDPAYEAAK